MQKVFVSLSAIALLSACSGGNADADGDGKISSTEADAEAAKAGLEPGLWEKGVEVTKVDLMLGKEANAEEKAAAEQQSKAMAGQSRQIEICLSPEDAKNPKAGFFAPGPEQGCEYSEYSVSGGKLKTSMQCGSSAMEEKMNVVMTGTYASDRFNSEYALNVDGGDKGSLKMTGKTSMKRIGDCPK